MSFHTQSMKIHLIGFTEEKQSNSAAPARATPIVDLNCIFPFQLRTHTPTMSMLLPRISPLPHHFAIRQY